MKNRWVSAILAAPLIVGLFAALPESSGTVPIDSRFPEPRIMVESARPVPDDFDAVRLLGSPLLL